MTARIISQIYTIAQLNTATHTNLLMPGPGGLCCCMSSVCSAELQTGCLHLLFLPRILACNCLLLLLAPQEQILIPCTLCLCSYFSPADAGRSLSSGTSCFAASLTGLQEWARAGGDEQSQYVPARPVLALHFSRSFISVARFSQAEFLTEISLFFSLPQNKGIHFPKGLFFSYNCRLCSHS